MKLEEAEFFLDLAERSQDNVKVFSFFINAFFAAATSIRVGKGVMKTEYRNIQGFKAWFQKARDDLNVKFPIDFWVDKTRLGIIDNESENNKEWAGGDLNPRAPPCQGGILTRLDHRPDIW